MHGDPASLSIFNEDEPMVYLESLDCKNYRKLAWRPDDDEDAEGSLDTDSGLVMHKPHAETNTNIRLKNLKDLVPDDRQLEDIRSVSACRVNISSPVIMQSGADGHRHAEKLRCLFAIQQVYDSRIAEKEAARQQQERARCLYEQMRLAELRYANNRQPSFCTESESISPDGKKKKSDEDIDEESVHTKLLHGFNISTKLPTGRISTLSEGLLEMPEEMIRLQSHRVPAPTIEATYSEASELLATHLNKLDDRKFIYQHGDATSREKGKKQ
ncbi:unnamed protein product [Dibothriocephalus latus]|uniref:Uncharacterized protein n=1 Tax=Dibothriocephalus latus TaxID=60516 RepID=A0A3P7M305_DIBLA|nr:unnamed protein product [Dibothriocephalus latus]